MILEARNITVAAGERHIVRSADVRLGPGELVGLVGPNGAGKSTLLRAIMGMRSRETGDVTLDGRPFGDLPSRRRARCVAYLPQDRRVEWRLSVADVVMLGRYPHRKAYGGPTEDCRRAAADALRAVDAARLAHLPFSVLSGGERTRVLLARALAVEAPLLLADEPIAALDPYHQIHVMEILQALARKGVGVLAVVHDLPLAARFMDRVMVMDHGVMVGEGAPGDMLSREMMSAVYGVDVLEGRSAEGRAWVLPWARTQGAAE